MAREFWLARDVASIKRATADIEAGLSRPAEELFDELRAKLLALKAERDAGGQRRASASE